MEKSFWDANFFEGRFDLGDVPAPLPATLPPSLPWKRKIIWDVNVFKGRFELGNHVQLLMISQAI